MCLSHDLVSLVRHHRIEFLSVLIHNLISCMCERRNLSSCCCSTWYKVDGRRRLVITQSRIELRWIVALRQVAQMHLFQVDHLHIYHMRKMRVKCRVIICRMESACLQTRWQLISSKLWHSCVGSIECSCVHIGVLQLRLEWNLPSLLGGVIYLYSTWRFSHKHWSIVVNWAICSIIFIVFHDYWRLLSLLIWHNSVWSVKSHFWLGLRMIHAHRIFLFFWKILLLVW